MQTDGRSVLDETAAVPLDARAVEAAVRLADPASRAIRLNLVLVGQSGVQELVERVATLHPLRAIVVDLDGADAAAHVSAGPRWECIWLSGRPSQLNRVVSTASALLMPGLPTSAYWLQAPDLESTLFSRIVDLADRIVVDSATASDPLGFIFSLDRHAAEKQSVVSFADLSWSRIYGWRLLAARLFDAPADRANLSSVRTLAVEHGGSLPEPLLLAGWFVSRLGWELWQPPRQGSLSRRAPIQLVAHTGARNVTIDIRPAGSGGLLHSLLIDADRTRYRVARENGSVCTMVETNDGQRVADVCSPDREPVDVLVGQLTDQGRDRIYTEAVAALAPLATLNAAR
ncbi:MAG: glucose-6-phosphate dehydrogenase assembly protein OpcA [Chloroflexi bacterium]|nr:glucose-6-phosphate dehydrogenase assembly protein OpcA [Chloroflexota bacterium]